MTILTSLALIACAAIHLAPSVGILGSKWLGKLYGLPIHEPNLLLLTQHRAVLFGLLGLALLFAAFKPQFHGVALLAGLVSVVAFLALAHFTTGELTPEIQRVVRVDWFALAFLLLGGLSHLMTGKPGLH